MTKLFLTYLTDYDLIELLNEKGHSFNQTK